MAPGLLHNAVIQGRWRLVHRRRVESDMRHARSRVRLEVEVIEEFDAREFSRMRTVQSYGLPTGWTPAKVNDLLLANGLTPEDTWLPAPEAVPPFWRSGNRG